MLFNEFIQLPTSEIEAHLNSCCGSQRWIKLVMEVFPWKNSGELLTVMESAWYNGCNESDYKEAFSHHPKIGDLASIEKKYPDTAHLASVEQSLVSSANSILLNDIAEANKKYEQKHGFIFIVFATGKTAGEMFRLISRRIEHSTESEIIIAMGEQYKITLNRLERIINDLQLSQGQVTTHVLDTSAGVPGKEILISFLKLNSDTWNIITVGLTNNDGRIPILLPASRKLPSGVYKMIFETEIYFKSQNIECFYPKVEVAFNLTNTSHYHIPLLISPYGYSTYRGS